MKPISLMLTLFLVGGCAQPDSGDRMGYRSTLRSELPDAEHTLLAGSSIAHLRGDDELLAALAVPGVSHA